MKKDKLDAYEQQIEDNLEKVIGKSILTPKLRKEIEAAAARPPHVVGGKEARINIRLRSATLAGLKARAEEAGMPYQTLASAVLHQVATGRLSFKLAKS
jgi:predicted DNA binding CopG/RHH family protein